VKLTEDIRQVLINSVLGMDLVVANAVAKFKVKDFEVKGHN
jgi:hypothetical protein